LHNSILFRRRVRPVVAYDGGESVESSRQPPDGLARARFVALTLSLPPIRRENKITR